MAEQLKYHVFIDTEVFDRHGNDFSTKGFKALGEFTRDGTVEIYLPDVIRREVESRIEQNAALSVNLLKKLSRESDHRYLRYFDDDLPLTKKAKSELAEQARSRFKGFLNDTKAKILSCDSVPLGVLMDQYFGGQPPFGENRKKEFPDALAIETIKRWTKENKTKAYVVSGNTSDWKTAFEGEPSIVYLPKLDDFLGLVTAELRPGPAEFIHNLLCRHKDEIVKTAKRDFLSTPLRILEPLGTLLDRVRSPTISSLDIDNANVLSVSDGNDCAVVAIPVRITFVVSAIPAPSYWRVELFSEYGTEPSKIEVFRTLETQMTVEFGFQLHELEKFDLTDISFPEIAVNIFQGDICPDPPATE